MNSLQEEKTGDSAEFEACARPNALQVNQAFEECFALCVEEAIEIKAILTDIGGHMEQYFLPFIERFPHIKRDRNGISNTVHIHSTFVWYLFSDCSTEGCNHGVEV